MKDYIYKITNNINGKVYIGKSKDPKKRFSQHCNGTSTISNAIRKYGVDNFTLEIVEEIVYETDDIHFISSNSNEREIYYIKLFNSFGDGGYNMTIGGDGIYDHDYGAKSAISEYQNSLLENGVHNFQNENNRKSVSETQKELLKSGTHNWQNPETEIKRKELSRKAVSKSNQDRLKNGTHYLKSDKHKNLMKDVMTDRNTKMLSDGTHPQLQIHICPHCNKSGKGSVMFRHHFNNCHLNISEDKICGL